MTIILNININNVCNESNNVNISMANNVNINV